MDFDALVSALGAALADPGGPSAATLLLPDPALVGAGHAHAAAIAAVARMGALPRPDPSTAQPFTWAPQLMARTEGGVAISGPNFEVRPRFAWSNMVTSLGGDVGQPNWIGRATGWAFHLAIRTSPGDGSPARNREVVVLVEDEGTRVIFPTGTGEGSPPLPLESLLGHETVDEEIEIPRLLATFASAAAVLAATLT